MLKFKIKPFNKLTVHELYQILKLRSEVFVVEQNCVYQDLDSKDQKAWHVLGYFKNEIVAYTRLFDKNLYFDEASIGRVVISPKHRNKKWGHLLMKISIETIQTKFNTSFITISAQEYLKKFYESHQFIQTSNTYLEDDIPHIQMKRT